MMLFNGCLICCDIDGTLISNGVIPKENIEKIKFFAENGGIFALATGRSVGAVGAVTEKIKDVSFGVFSNGGMIYDFAKEKIIFEARVPKSDYEVMYKVKEAFPDIGIEIHYRKNAGVYNKTSETDDHEIYEGLSSEIYTKEQLEKLSLNKILYALNDESDIPVIHSFVENIPHICQFIDTSATLYGRKRFYFEQIPQGISKSAGVLKLADMLEIKNGNLFAAGDYFNDLDMLKAADISCAPSGSPEEIKNAVTYVAKSVENGAVADFIDYLTDLRRK